MDADSIDPECVVATEFAEDVERLVIVNKTLFLRAVWVAIICWIHCCWAGLNSGASLDTVTPEDDVVVLLPDDADEVAAAEEVMLNVETTTQQIFLYKRRKMLHSMSVLLQKLITIS